MSKKAKKSSGAVARVWQIASKLGPKVERKDVLAACERAGINSSTAKTQWQQFKHASPAERKGKLEPKN